MMERRVSPCARRLQISSASSWENLEGRPLTFFSGIVVLELFVGFGSGSILFFELVELLFVEVELFLEVLAVSFEGFKEL